MPVQYIIIVLFGVLVMCVSVYVFMNEQVCKHKMILKVLILSSLVRFGTVNRAESILLYISEKKEDGDACRESLQEIIA